jgi:hypothetical protein
MLLPLSWIHQSLLHSIHEYGKTKEKEKVNIIASPEFGSTLCRRKLTINKSLHGLKTSAGRSHEHLEHLEHLAESLLSLGFTKPSRTMTYG